MALQQKYQDLVLEAKKQHYAVLRGIYEKAFSDVDIKIGDYVRTDKIGCGKFLWNVVNIRLLDYAKDDFNTIDMDIVVDIKRVNKFGILSPYVKTVLVSDVKKDSAAGLEPKCHSKDKTFVYVMFDANTCLFKIGRSKTPVFRERTLQSEKPSISLVFYFEGLKETERALHKKYKKKQIRGEWFALTNQDIKDLRSEFKGDGLVEVLDQNQAKK
jgi:hypothetical protein